MLTKEVPFREIVEQYKVVFFDAYGVLKNHSGLLPGVKNTLDFMRDRDIDFFVLTNDSSRGPITLSNNYKKLGIDVITPEKMISSGMLAREYLQAKVNQGTIAYLGTEASAHYIEEVGLPTLPISQVDLEHSDHISALVLLDDEGFDWNVDISRAINLLRRRNMPVIVANTDNSYPVSRNDVAVATGGIAGLIERVVGREFMRFGKPSVQMFIFAYEHILEHHPGLSKRDILMVGDTLHTDIVGGNKFGLDTALVLTGNTLPQQANFLIRSTGIIPDYICPSIDIGDTDLPELVDLDIGPI